MLKEGSVLKGRYVIDRHLGKGGMGSVYLATDRTFGSTVALKETIVEGQGLEEAFEREARVLNKLRHGAIPVVMDYFIEGDGRFLVMQYIPGDDLSALIARANRPFPVDRVLEWADQLLEALVYLHTQDPPIVHRDIKPQNLKLTDREQIVLLDFGLSKAATGGDGAQNLSVAGYTPSYAPIEQIQAAGTDARSDLFSLAATIYHLLTGVKPVDAIRRLMTRPDPLEPIHKLNSAVSRQVSDVIMSALAVRPEDRPATAAEMRSTLRGAAFDDLLALAHEFGVDSGSGSLAPAPAPVAAAVAGDSADLQTLVPPGPVEASLSGTGDPATVVTPFVDLSAAAKAAPAARAPEPVDLQTVVTPVVPGFAPAAPPPRAPESVDLRTVVTPPVPDFAPAAPAPRAKNTAAPSTVSFVFESVTLGSAGEVEGRKKLVGKQFFEDTGGGASIGMVVVPGGTFTFGSPEDEPGRDESEGPTLEVTIGPLFVSRFEITQAQWRAVAASLPRVRVDLNADPSHFKGDDRPVEKVSWEEACEFCDRLAAHTGRDYRLPSEAEWEYACRAGSAAPFGFGPVVTVEVANIDGDVGYEDAPGGDSRAQTAEVGSYAVANRFGLSDMHGNVWEWTADCWHGSLEGAPTNGASRVEGGDPTVRVIRGGSWASIPHDARSAKRFSFLQTGRRNDIGFRIVLAPGG